MPKKEDSPARKTPPNRRKLAASKKPRRTPRPSGGAGRPRTAAGAVRIASAGRPLRIADVSETHPPEQALDVNVFGRNAANDAERHKALVHAVTNLWAGADISVIRRVESSPSHRWVMWRRSAVPPA